MEGVQFARGRRSGVYAIVNRTNGKSYIGSSINIPERWAEHRVQLARGSHHSAHLQRAWRKYGAEAFEFVVLELTEPDPPLLRVREQAHMDERFRRCGSIEYNICPYAGSVAEAELTPEAKARRDRGLAFGRGRPLTPEEHAALIEASARVRRGVPLSAEQRAKIGAAHRGREYSEAQLRGLREKHEARRGGHHSEETRAKMRAAWERRKQRPASEKQRAAWERMRAITLNDAQRAALAKGWNRGSGVATPKQLAASRANLANTPTHRKAASPQPGARPVQAPLFGPVAGEV